MCEHCHEEEYNAVILNLEDQDLECGVITIFEMDGQDYIALFDDEDELNAASDCFDEWLDEQEFLDSDE